MLEKGKQKETSKKAKIKKIYIYRVLFEIKEIKQTTKNKIIFQIHIMLIHS